MTHGPAVYRVALWTVNTPGLRGPGVTGLAAVANKRAVGTFKAVRATEELPALLQWNPVDAVH
jgi:hypothetical protein